MSATPQPEWLPIIRLRAKRSADEFHTNVRRIAVRLARHDGEPRIGFRHVDGAVEALRKAGLRGRPA